MDALPLLHEYSALATSPSKAASKVSTSTTAFQIVTTMAGTGILQLPYTVAQGGWITLFLLLLVAAITNWTNRLLVASLYLDPTADRLPGYPEVGKAAFGYTGYVLVQIFHKFTLFGVSSIFLILAAKFLTEGLGGDGDGLLDHTSFFSPGTDWTKIWTIVSAICVLFPVIYYRTLGENRAMSIFGSFSTIVAVAVILFFSVFLNPLTPDNANHDDDAFEWHKPDHKWVDLALLPSAFSAIVLSFGGAAVIPSIEAGMQEPVKFVVSLNRAFAIITVLYLVTAIAGYATFGDLTFSPILCNLPRGDDLSGRIVEATKLLVAGHVISAYPLLMNALVTEVESKVPALNESALLRGLERTVFVAGTALTALFLPFFGEIVSLVGAGALTMMAFVMPVVFNFKLRRDRGLEIGGKELAAGAGVCLVGAVGGGIGFYQAIGDLVSAFNAQ